jgi:hypothetical protein
MKLCIYIYVYMYIYISCARARAIFLATRARAFGFSIVGRMVRCYTSVINTWWLVVGELSEVVEEEDVVDCFPNWGRSGSAGADDGGEDGGSVVVNEEEFVVEADEREEHVLR